MTKELIKELQEFVQETKMTFENRYFNSCFSFKNRYEYIEKLYKPYKIRGNKDELLKDSPKFQTEERKKGDVLKWGYDKKGFWVVFLPTNDEYEKIKAFAEIEGKREKICRLSALQIQLQQQNKSFEELEIIENKIDKLYNYVFSDVVETTNHKTPFNTDEQKKVFKYLKDNWVFNKQIRYAYIFKFMVDTLEHKIDFSTYNKFIKSKYGIKVQRSNTNRKSNYEALRELMDEYKP